MDRFGRSLSTESSTPEERVISEEMMENASEDIIIESNTIEVDENRRNVEKRVREEISEDDGFTTVTKKPKKQLIRRNDSLNNNCTEIVGSCENNTQQPQYFEVCLTSKTVLPKMVGMAKLLKSQNINDILKIKYKSPYKMFIVLKYTEDANKVLNCQKFKELEFSCQRTDQLSIIYGIVRNIDLELEENELSEIFQSEADICAVKRLKRLNEDGQWVNSEAIRIGFKGATLPTYIYGYGCRFKVESYMFPVTQCSGCWKYGHIKRFCPTQKILCPKCGKGHDNCETKDFTCINCKGSHMALNKSCPMYLKEKMIREIMSKDKCSYKIALDSYLKQIRKRSEITPVNTEGRETVSSMSSSRNRSYRDSFTPLEVLTHPVNTCMDSSASLEEISEDEEEASENRTTTKRNKKKNKIQNEKNKEQIKKGTKKNENGGQAGKSHKEIVEENPNKTESVSKLKIFYNKFKEIWLSDYSTTQKVKNGVRLVLEEIIMYIVTYFKDWDIVSNLYRLLRNG